MKKETIDWVDVGLKGGSIVLTILSALLGGIKNKRDLDRAVEIRVSKEIANLQAKGTES